MYGVSGENTCVFCGAVIPEGRMVCPSCQAEDMRCVKAKNDYSWLSYVIAVIIGMAVMFGACCLSYRFGVNQAVYKANFEDWQVHIDASQDIAVISTDYGLDWVYQFAPGYLEECMDDVL